MDCLYCGDCCLRLSPLSEKECPKLIQHEDFYFCGIYQDRPKECKNHTFPFRFCPIGLDKLKLTETSQIALRIDEGYKIINPQP